MPRELSNSAVRYWKSTAFPRELTPAERRHHATAARVVSRRMTRRAKDELPRKTGRLQRSVRGSTTRRQQTAVLNLSTNTPYAVYVELGKPALRTKDSLKRIFRRFYPKWRESIRTGLVN